MEKVIGDGLVVDILINNAGIGVRDYALDCSLEFEQNVMNVNYLSHIVVTKALLRQAIDREMPMQVVNILSV